MKQRITTRALMTCVVLGAFGALVIHVSHFINHAMKVSLPWLANPTPVPWWIFTLIAIFMIPRTGIATLQGIVAAVIGFGTMSLVTGIIVEAVMWVGRAVGPAEVLRSKARPIPYREIWWALLASILCALFTYSLIVFVPEFSAFTWDVKIYALVIRLSVGVLALPIAYWIASALLKAGRDPQGLLQDCS